MVNTNKGNLGSKVFFIWGSTCCICVVYAYFCVWETKGLTLEQVDRMMEEVRSPRKSAGWRPHSTYAADLGMTADGTMPIKAKGDLATEEKMHLAAGTRALHNEESRV